MIESYPQEMIPLGQLNAAEYNPRSISKSEFAKLGRSLSEFGFLQPVVARREDGLILGGHQRVEAYKRLLRSSGVTEETIHSTPVPVIRLSGISDARAKTINLALNRISGEWDYVKLGGVLSELVLGSDDDDFSAQLAGFGEDEIANILGLVTDPLIAMPEEPAGASDVPLGVVDGLAAQARRFSFTVADDATARECGTILKRYGWTGPGNAAAAFVAALRAASGSAPKLEQPKVEETGAGRESHDTEEVEEGEIAISAAGAEEVDAVYALWKRLMRTVKNGELSPPMPAQLRQNAKTGELLQARAPSGAVVGFALFHKRKDEWVTLYDIAVSGAYRGRGVARRLIDTINAMGPIRLKCAESNPANQFYAKIGFTRVGETETRTKRRMLIWERAKAELQVKAPVPMRSRKRRATT